MSLLSGEVQALQRELELVSAQHWEKCLENSELNQQLQDQGQALKQCHKQIQELKTKQVLFLCHANSLNAVAR